MFHIWYSIEFNNHLRRTQDSQSSASNIKFHWSIRWTSTRRRVPGSLWSSGYFGQGWALKIWFNARDNPGRLKPGNQMFSK